MFSKTIVLVTDNAMLTKSIEENADLSSIADVSLHIMSPFRVFDKKGQKPSFRKLVEHEPKADTCETSIRNLRRGDEHYSRLPEIPDSRSANGLKAIAPLASGMTVAQALNAHDGSLHIISGDNHSLLPFKIDLLILDSDDFRSLQPHRVKTIINLSNNEYFSAFLPSNEIKITKPFKLNKLLQLIEKLLRSSDLFCAINEDYIYNERLQILTSEKEVIKFTEKENQIFKAILLEANFEITKELLLKDIWRYHEDSETSTVDTHIYKLKAKLPSGMLDVKNNLYKLIVIP